MQSSPDSRACLTFSLGEASFGLDLAKIAEVSRNAAMTPVPLAPAYVVGILNLRGTIVTVLDLGTKLQISPALRGESSCILILKARGESLGLLVDRIGKVLYYQSQELAPAPVNSRGVQEKRFHGVLSRTEGLIAVLDLEEVLQVEVDGP